MKLEKEYRVCRARKKIGHKNLLLLITILASTATVIAEEARDFHRYLYANYKQFCGDLKGAQRSYNELMRSNTSPYAYKGYIHFLHNSGQHHEVARLAPELEKKFSNDPDLGLIFAQAFKKIGDIQEANKRTIQLSQTHKKHPEIILVSKNQKKIYTKPSLLLESYGS